MPDRMTADPDYGVDDFRAPNLVAILRAVPQTDGTCSAVASKAQEFGSTVPETTLDDWLQEGREDLIAGDTETAFARFVTAYDERKNRPNAKAGGQIRLQIRGQPMTSLTAAPDATESCVGAGKR